MCTSIPVIEIRSNVLQYIWEYVHEHNTITALHGRKSACASMIQGEAQESFLFKIWNN